MSCCLWTDYGLTEDLLDQRLFPKIFILANQMWSNSTITLNDFLTVLIKNLKLADNVFPYILYIFIVRTRMSAR